MNDDNDNDDNDNDDRRRAWPSYKLTFGAFDSGELKTQKTNRPVNSHLRSEI